MAGGGVEGASVLGAGVVGVRVVRPRVVVAGVEGSCVTDGDVEGPACYEFVW